MPLALADVTPAFVTLALLMLVAAFALAIVDYRATPAPSTVPVERVAEPQLSIGVGNRVTVRLRNPFALPLRATVRDTVPTSFDVDRRTAELVVGPGATAEAAYAARPRHRGSFRFGDVHIRLRGPLDLLQRQGRVAAEAPANVYPDLHEIRRYEVSLRRGLAYDAGQRRARTPGAGSLFERLREYQPDDDPRWIAWTATARRGRPISVEYETERQQRVLILLDAGRMMSSTLGRLTKLDHAVNTALMLSYVAIAKGDEVGLLGFADTVRAYDPARRGHRQFLRLTESLRRLEVTMTEPDYRAAFEFLRAKTARRAFAILFTDLVDEEASRALVAALTQLAGNNLVLCCVLQDPQLAETAARDPSSSGELYERVVAAEVLDARRRALAVLRRHGVHSIDVPAERLSVATIQRYLELKKRFF
ncbi:MAG: DUF58 domain-containing protein [Chloroflexi bacterium]|nr:MAG: DUF58 domain-containing protein [Chloroflexota bacterium]